MSFTPSHIATLATSSAIDDLRIFLKTLSFWNSPPPPVYLFCDATVAAAIPSFGYTGELVIKEALTQYTGLNRAQMESMPGIHYKNLFFDFVCEKLTLMEWVFSTTDSSGVLFCDADICFLAPLFHKHAFADCRIFHLLVLICVFTPASTPLFTPLLDPPAAGEPFARDRSHEGGRRCEGSRQGSQTPRETCEERGEKTNWRAYLLLSVGSRVDRCL
jgi:hypothetical protein